MSSRKLAAFGAAIVALTIGAAPILTSAADHLDAPALGRTTMNGQIDIASFRGDRDINDVYVFRAPDSSKRTVLAMTVNPAINLFGGNFGRNVRYVFNIDTQRRQQGGPRLRHPLRPCRSRRRRQVPGAGLHDQEVHRQRCPLARRREDRRVGRVQRGQRQDEAEPAGLGRCPLRPVLLRPARVHRHDHVADRDPGRHRHAR